MSKRNREKLSGLAAGLVLLVSNTFLACGIEDRPTDSGSTELSYGMSTDYPWKMVFASGGKPTVDIGAGANGAVWLLSIPAGDGGYCIFRKDGVNWTQVAGSAKRIDVADDGTPWIVGTDDYAYYYDGNQWRKPDPACPRLRDIGAAGGAVFAVTQTPVPNSNGGYQITELIGTRFQPHSGAALRIDVDPRGQPVIVAGDGQIFIRYAFQWQSLGYVEPCCVVEVGRMDITYGGPGGQNYGFFVVGARDYAGSYQLYRWSGGPWGAIDGSGVAISAGVNGVPWVAAKNGSVWTL